MSCSRCFTREGWAEQVFVPRHALLSVSVLFPPLNGEGGLLFLPARYLDLATRLLRYSASGGDRNCGEFVFENHAKYNRWIDWLVKLVNWKYLRRCSMIIHIFISVINKMGINRICLNLKFLFLQFNCDEYYEDYD